MRVLSGIEGGGTKTTCVIGDEAGRLLGTGQGGSSNYLAVGISRMRTSIADSQHEALGALDFKASPQTAYAGLAGIGLIDPPSSVELAVKEATGAENVLVTSDSYVAYYGAFVGQPGVILISGTGSIAMGVGESGELARSGGWGHILGDEGSAHHLGLEGIRAVVRSYDLILPHTSLTDASLDFFRIKRVEDLVRAFYLEGIDKENLATFSEKVVEAAISGDEVAVRIVDAECEALKSTVGALIGRLRLRNPKLALCGGVFEGSEWFRRRFAERLDSEVEIVKPLHRPVVGAFILELMSTGIELTSAVIGNIEQSEKLLFP